MYPCMKVVQLHGPGIPCNTVSYPLGGHGSDGNVNDVYELNLQTWKWSLLEVPDESQKMSPRDKHTAWFYNNKYVQLPFIIRRSIH